MGEKYKRKYRIIRKPVTKKTSKCNTIHFHIGMLSSNCHYIRQPSSSACTMPPLPSTGAMTATRRYPAAIPPQHRRSAATVPLSHRAAAAWPSLSIIQLLLTGRSLFRFSANDRTVWAVLTPYYIVRRRRLHSWKCERETFSSEKRVFPIFLMGNEWLGWKAALKIFKTFLCYLFLQ